MTTGQIMSVQWQLTAVRIREWLQSGVFSVRWWVLLALFTAIVLYSWKKVDKGRLKELVLYAAMITLFVIVLDELGEELTLWYYTVDLVPLFPPITAVDLSCLPAVYLLIYQKNPTWKRFVIASAVMSAAFCFLLEPLFVWAGVYKTLTWKSYYGFPIYILIAVITKWSVQTVFSIEKKRTA